MLTGNNSLSYKDNNKWEILIMCELSSIGIQETANVCANHIGETRLQFV